MKKRVFSVAISIFIIIILMIFFRSLENNMILVEEKNSKLKYNKEISQLSKNMQTILNLSMQYVEFLELIIKNNPNVTPELLENYSNYIIENNNIIDNISIAPDCIVKYVYPLEGNENAIGHDLLNDPERKPFIEKSIETNSSVAQGPVEAMQGGLKIFNRKALFINEGEEEKLWGVVAVTIDFNELVTMFNLDNKYSNCLYAIRAHKPNGVKDFLWGNEEIFDKDSIIKFINLPNETWQIAIYPKEGWRNNISTYKHISYLILIISFLFTYLCINHYQNLKEAAKLDPLTGVYNKRYFERYVKKKFKISNKNHGLILVDLDKFKSINDTLGHPIGDKVLREVVNRIKSLIGDNDKIGRIGGDEFIIFINDVNDEGDLHNIISSIKNKMKLPMDFGKNKLEISCSLGLAIYENDGKSYNDLYKAADEKMYIDKTLKMN